MRTGILIRAVVLGALSAGSLPGGSLAQSTEALELLNRGLAQLEYEDPAGAEATFRRLAELVPEDPLAHALIDRRLAFSMDWTSGWDTDQALSKLLIPWR